MNWTASSLTNTINLAFDSSKNNGNTDDVVLSIMDEKVEEEEEEEKYQGNLMNVANKQKSKAMLSSDHYSQIDQISNFIEYRVDDYMKCEEENNITNCHAIQRIIHLLEHQKNRHPSLADNKEGNLLIYEYITSFNKYDASTFMEDWYHCKTKHFKTEFDYKWFEEDQQMNCNNNYNKNCVYIQRYQRERGRETYHANNEIDHKNIILRDQLDSIHAFIFHPSPSRRNQQYEVKDVPSSDDSEESEDELVVTTNGGYIINKTNGGKDDHKNQICGANDSDDNSLVESEHHIDIMEEEILIEAKNVSFRNISDVNVERSINLAMVKEKDVNISDDDDEKVSFIQTTFINNVKKEIDNINDKKLNEHKNKIIEYFKQNQINDDAFNKFERKEFSASIADHCNDKKLKGKLMKLYKELKKYKVDNNNTTEDTQNAGDDDVMIIILNEAINTINNKKMNEHKGKIVEYFKQNQIDYNKLENIGRNEFRKGITKYCNEPKLGGALMKLYKAIQTKSKDIVRVEVDNEEKKDCIHEKVEKQKGDIGIKNSKFVTSIKQNESKPSYYSFGEQFRYTQNLRDHPLFIQPKYKTIKEELMAYFQRVHGADDKQRLLNQLKIIDSTSHTVQAALKEFVEQEIEKIDDSDDILDTFWCDDIKLKDDEEKHDVIELIKLENMNYTIIIKTITELLQHLPKNLTLFTDYIFVALLNVKLEDTNRRNHCWLLVADHCLA